MVVILQNTPVSRVADLLELRSAMLAGRLVGALDGLCDYWEITRDQAIA
jgi:hypothetical protein